MLDKNQKKRNSEAVDEIKKAIFNAVESIFVKILSTAPCQGHIIDVLDDQNKYKVQIGGAVFTVPCCLEEKLNIGDTVIIIYLQNNVNNKYIIGKVVSECLQ